MQLVSIGVIVESWIGRVHQSTKAAYQEGLPYKAILIASEKERSKHSGLSASAMTLLSLSILRMNALLSGSLCTYSLLPLPLLHFLLDFQSSCCTA